MEREESVPKIVAQESHNNRDCNVSNRKRNLGQHDHVDVEEGIGLIPMVV
jgi:hypothetical protein